jgi:hypothetical protein
MPSRRPDLIVPIRDRRQRKRYLTLKNFGWAFLAAVILFIGISLMSEMRGTNEHGYGRLFDQVSSDDVERKPVEVVQEAPVAVDDATHADPMLVEPAARAQWLEDDTTTATTTVAPPVTASTVTQGKGDVVVVGGPEGVTVVRKERRKPVLSGGFGRQ